MASQLSDSTAIQQPESEEDILPIEVVLAMGSEKTKRGSRGSRILKTTEVEICGDQDDEEEKEKEKVRVCGGENEKRRTRGGHRRW